MDDSQTHKKKYPGVWICYEGPDFSGTTSQLQIAHNRIYKADKSHFVLTIPEPSMRKHGRKIRRWQLDPNIDIRSKGHLFLPKYAADREDIMTSLVIPFLHQGGIVLSDRSFYSTLVYQGIQGKSPQEVLEAHEFMKEYAPDVTLVFDIDLEHAMDRMKNAGAGHQEAWDKEEFIRESIMGYRRLPEMLEGSGRKDNIVYINARPDIATVTEECWKHIQPLLPMEYAKLRSEFGK